MTHSHLTLRKLIPSKGNHFPPTPLSGRSPTQAVRDPLRPCGAQLGLEGPQGAVGVVRPVAPGGARQAILGHST